MPPRDERSHHVADDRAWPDGLDRSARIALLPRAYKIRLALAWVTIGLCVVAIGILQYVAMQMLADETAQPAAATMASPTPQSSLAIALLTLAMLSVIGALLLGYGLLVWLIIQLMEQRLRPKLTPGKPAHRTAYLEAFAIFLVSFIGLQILGGIVTELTGLPTMPIVLLLAIAPIFWPLAVGVGFTQFRKDMGLIAPNGVMREIGVGIVGYITGLPVLAIGIVISAALAYYTGMTGGHPISQEAANAGPGLIIMLIVMAVVWAPLAEEAIFRGSLYRHLRSKPGWANWLNASLLSSFIFAAIHPQGIVGIPVLMSIAFVLANMREMRDSIIPCIVAHALNNGFVMTLLIITLYG